MGVVCIFRCVSMDRNHYRCWPKAFVWRLFLLQIKLLNNSISFIQNVLMQLLENSAWEQQCVFSVKYYYRSDFTVMFEKQYWHLSRSRLQACFSATPIFPCIPRRPVRAEVYTKCDKMKIKTNFRALVCSDIAAMSVVFSHQAVWSSTKAAAFGGLLSRTHRFTAYRVWKAASGQPAACRPLGSLVAVAHLSPSQCEHITDLDQD